MVVVCFCLLFLFVVFVFLGKKSIKYIVYEGR